MKNNYFNNYSLINVYSKKSIKSKITTQLIYGEKFKILKKNKKWIKIKLLDYKYSGFILNKNYIKKFRPTYKVYILKSRIYDKPFLKNKTKNFLPFNSKIENLKEENNFIKFKKNMWILKKNIKPLKFTYKNIFNNIKIFKNIKYKWGGRSFLGIDCSALLQLFLQFNNKYCPRDTVDQIKFFKKSKTIKKNSLLFWKGHVAIVLSKNKMIHAYGPKQKVVIMKINDSIKIIKKTANLELLAVKKLK